MVLKKKDRVFDEKIREEISGYSKSTAYFRSVFTEKKFKEIHRQILIKKFESEVDQDRSVELTKLLRKLDERFEKVIGIAKYNWEPLRMDGAFSIAFVQPYYATFGGDKYPIMFPSEGILSIFEQVMQKQTLRPLKQGIEFVVHHEIGHIKWANIYMEADIEQI